MAVVCLGTFSYGHPLGCGGWYPPDCNDICDEVCGTEDAYLCGDCAANLYEGVPIDGGLSWLLLAGAGLAGNHIRKKRKKRMAGVEVK